MRRGLWHDMGCRRRWLGPVAGTSIDSQRYFPQPTLVGFMSTSRASRLVAALLVAPLVFLAGTISARSLFRCKYYLVTRTSCCCPQPEGPESSAEAMVGKSCCCDIEPIAACAVTDARGLIDRFAPSRSDRVPLVAILDMDRALSTHMRLRTIVERAHAPPGPPILLLKRSLLI
jgi:hypothetical protein